MKYTDNVQLKRNQITSSDILATYWLRPELDCLMLVKEQNDHYAIISFDKNGSTHYAWYQSTLFLNYDEAWDFFYLLIKDTRRKGGQFPSKSTGVEAS